MSIHHISQYKLRDYLLYLLRSKILKDYITVLTGSSFMRVLSFLTSIILARQLGPQGFGQFSVFFAILTIFWTSTNFIDSTYVRYAAVAKYEDRMAYLRGSFVAKTFIYIVLMFSSYPIAKLLSTYVFSKPELETIVTLGIFSGAALTLVSMKASVYQVFENFTGFTTLNTLFYVITFSVLLILFLGKISLSVGLVCGIYTISALIMAIVSFISLYKATKPIAIEKSIIIQIFSFAQWLIAANITYIIFQRLDVLILTRYASLDNVGQYGASLRITSFASILTGNLNAPLLPRATRTRISSDLLRNYLKHAFLISCLISIVIGILWLLTPTIVKSFLGTSYIPSIPIARALLLSSIFIAIYTPLSQLFLSEDSPKKVFFMNLIKLVAVLGSGLLLIPTYGALGAAYATVFSEFVTMLYVFITIKSRLINGV
jgi:O-antigen/teichoic acid export membrane protein